MFGPIHAVVFDFDGTLVDTMSSVITGLGSAIEKTTGRKIPEAELVASFGPAPLGVLKQWMPEDQVPTAMQHWLDFEKNMGPEDMRIFPGVEKLLETLKQKNLAMGIFTGRDRKGALRICSAQKWLGKYFTEDTMVCGDDGYTPKPKSDALLALMKKMQLTPSTTLMVGDHIYDAMAGKAAGTKTAAALWDNKEIGPTERSRFKALWQKWDSTEVDIRLTTPESLLEWLK